MQASIVSEQREMLARMASCVSPAHLTHPFHTHPTTTQPIFNTAMFVVHGPTYMTVITSKDPEWQDLPGNPGSLLSFVAQCGHTAV